MVEKKIRTSGPDTKFRAAPAILVNPKRSVPKGEAGVEEFLICRNEECRFLISLRDGNRLLRRSELILNACPECNHGWSSRCPFCAQALGVVWRNEVPCCSHCSRPLQPAPGRAE